MTSTSTYLDEFHEALGEPVPAELTTEQLALRALLITEEYHEVMEAFRDLQREDTLRTRAHLGKELADLEYVLRGAARFLGMPFDQIVAEVHRSNMTKVTDGIHRRDDGKLEKGPAFEEADIAEILYQHCRAMEHIATQFYLVPWYAKTPVERAEAESCKLPPPMTKQRQEEEAGK